MWRNLDILYSLQAQRLIILMTKCYICFYDGIVVFTVTFSQMFCRYSMTSIVIFFSSL